jgi:hypothetical protein
VLALRQHLHDLTNTQVGSLKGSGAEEDLVGRLRRSTFEQSWPQCYSVTWRHRDGGHVAPGDRDDTVVAVHPTRDAMFLEHRFQLGGRQRTELGVDGDLPALAIQRRGVNQPAELGAKGEGGGNSRNRHHRSGQRRAYRN